MTRDLLIAASAPVVWGSTYLVTSELLPPGRPLLAATLRALPVGILMTIYAGELPRRAWWWRSAVLGTLNIGAFFALLFVAAYRLPGGVAATAGAIQPLIVASLAVAVLGERLRATVAVAGLLGVAGVGLLVLGPEAELDPIGVAAALAGTLSMASGVVLTKRWTRPTALLTTTGWQLTAGGLLLLPLTLVVEGPPPELTHTHVAGYGWLAIVGTGLAYTLWFRGIDRLPVNALTFLGLLSPLVATSLGWLVLDQGLTAIQLGGVALVIAAVVLPQRRTTPPPGPGTPAAAERDRSEGGLVTDPTAPEAPSVSGPLPLDPRTIPTNGVPVPTASATTAHQLAELVVTHRERPEAAAYRLNTDPARCRDARRHVEHDRSPA